MPEFWSGFQTVLRSPFGGGWETSPLGPPLSARNREPVPAPPRLTLKLRGNRWNQGEPSLLAKFLCVYSSMRVCVFPGGPPPSLAVASFLCPLQHQPRTPSLKLKAQGHRAREKGRGAIKPSSAHLRVRRPRPPSAALGAPSSGDAFVNGALLSGAERGSAWPAAVALLEPWASEVPRNTAPGATKRSGPPWGGRSMLGMNGVGLP